MIKERYVRGPHTVTELKYHFVWKTKYSYGVLKGEIALRVRDIIREICKENSMEVLKGNVRPNHIHIMVRGPAYLSVSKMAQYLKGKSSYRLQREFPGLQIKEYIENQTEEPGTFKVWDEEEPPEEEVGKLKSDNSSE